MMCENIAGGGATQVVDLRSDFVARSTPAMVDAMLRAARQPCGFGLREDTIVANLENRAAATGHFAGTKSMVNRSTPNRVSSCHPVIGFRCARPAAALAQPPNAGVDL